MAFYVKVTKEVADYLGVPDISNKTADGNVLLWQWGAEPKTRAKMF